MKCIKKKKNLNENLCKLTNWKTIHSYRQNYDSTWILEGAKWSTSSFSKWNMYTWISKLLGLYYTKEHKGKDACLIANLRGKCT